MTYAQQYHQRVRPRQQQYQVVEEETTLRPKVYEIRSQSSPNLGDGRFQYSVETSDGLRAEQEGYLHRPQQSQVHEGSYTTFDEFGKVVLINYIADKDGFRVAGDSLPTSPPVPAEHLKATADILRQQQQIRNERLGNLRAAYATQGH